MEIVATKEVKSATDSEINASIAVVIDCLNVGHRVNPSRVGKRHSRQWILVLKVI